MKKAEPEYYPPVENLLDLIYEHYTENNPVEKNTVAGKAAKAKEKELEELLSREAVAADIAKVVIQVIFTPISNISSNAIMVGSSLPVSFIKPV